ncbi:hypothetical protein [Hymenobacter sp. GOD-10R]|uniref:hypothetical protein n=1 Tax=Hymenobacter sp. GOD-10R TaxID=3093922 RepID=UPI002D76E313|nr:hypothetical protein [Hymenobacter sp. GOD-10R]WRQ31816.1 hypothetical protein SD425_28625 [Hymenobacter sp. GOD-10R]
MNKKVFLSTILVLSCWLLVVPGLAQPSTSSCSGQRRDLYSQVPHEQRSIWVHVPATTNPQARFPVLYVLDGENYFASTVAVTEQLAGRWPRLIVVGILNTNRGRSGPDAHARSPHASLCRSGDGKRLRRWRTVWPVSPNGIGTPYRLALPHDLLPGRERALARWASRCATARHPSGCL